MNPTTSVITLTFGDAAENHVGMEMIGTRGSAGSGFTVAELRELAGELPGAELYELHSRAEHEEAAVLVIRGFLDEATHAAVFAEQAGLEHDKKAFMYGRVVNKKARWNLCFDEEGHDPDYASGKGRVVALADIPATRTAFVDLLPTRFGSKAEGLKGEGNYYYDVGKCGIGWHGDTERRKVVALRLGAAMPIYYRWYHWGAPVGDALIIPLNGGDVYVMSEKAVGADWKSPSKWTLRHATGAHAGIA